MRALTVLMALFLATSASAKPTSWQSLSNGIDYATLDTPSLVGKLHAFRIDLNRYLMSLVLAQDTQEPMASVKRLADDHDAMIAINGGFFGPDHLPLGLRIQDGKIRAPLKTSTAWWGVFYVEGNKAHVVPPKSFQYNSQMSFAVQAGPRLLVNGKIPPLKENLDERSALCITQDGHVIIAATDNAPLTTTQLASLLKTSDLEGGLSCRDALNLDGGTSTQLYANLGNFYLYVPSFMPIADAIVVRKK